MLRIFDDISSARRELLDRRPEGEVERPADVRESNLRVFGRDLSPSEAVDEIIAAVRNDGDAGLRRFERELGGNTRESLLVQPEEFDEAGRLVSPEVHSALEFAAERVRRFHEKALAEKLDGVRRGRYAGSDYPAIGTGGAIRARRPSGLSFNGDPSWSSSESSGSRVHRNGVAGRRQWQGGARRASREQAGRR